MPALLHQTFSFETVTLDRAGAVVSRSAGQARQALEDLGGGVTLALVSVPGGSFQMGSRHEGGYPDERPAHPVFLAPFWLGKYPVTQAQWQAVMGRLPYTRFHGADLPIESICWQDAGDFCLRLSKKTGRAYSLPSEAQWEYACRAGTSTPFAFGETVTTDYANYVGDHTFRDEPPGIYRHVLAPGGAFPPNPWGLYDMHGGLWEFCADAWQEDYSGAPVDGSPRAAVFQGNKIPIARVARGGSWHEPPAHCRSAVRLRVAEDDRMEYYGFRVMLAGETK
jgi:formylglycine-generating enzyme required for sulfatase activity